MARFGELLFRIFHPKRYKRYKEDLRAIEDFPDFSDREEGPIPSRFESLSTKAVGDKRIYWHGEVVDISGDSVVIARIGFAPSVMARQYGSGYTKTYGYRYKISDNGRGFEIGDTAWYDGKRWRKGEKPDYEMVPLD